ncbi:MAG: EAL domain-containing protein [Methylobacter sp.]|nr:MAG: EAL domain-containing protein [Methylobacter sp.]
MNRSLSSLLLYPATALMNRLSFYKKFAMLGLIALIAFCVTLYSFYINLNQVITSSQRELDGLAIIRPLAETIQFAQQHRGLSSAVLSGANELKPMLVEKEFDIKAALTRVEARLPANTRQLKSWKNIANHWKRIQANGLQWSHMDNISAHTQLIGEILLFVIDISDSYGLTANTDLDTFYLVHTLSHELLNALEHLGQIRAYGTGILGVKQVSEQQKILMNTLIWQLNDTLASLNVSMEKAARYNPEIRNTLFSTYENVQKSSQQVIEAVHSDVLSENFAMDAEAFFAITTTAINHGYTQLYQSMLPTVEELIRVRIQRTEATLLSTFSIALPLLLLVVYLMAAIYKTTLGSIQELSRSVRGFARGDLSDRVHLETYDELSQIGDSFNTMADELTELFEVRQAAAQYSRSLIEASLDTLMMINAEGEITDINTATERVTGLDRAKLIGSDFSGHFTDPLKAHTGYQQVFSQGGVIDYPLVIRHVSGKTIDVLYNFSPYRDGKGNVLGVFAAARDITERKKTEADLRIAATAFESQEGMLVSDANNIILRVNGAFTKITGYSAEEVIGQNPRILQSGRQDTIFYTAMWKSINDTGSWEGEVWNRRKNGEIFPERLTITAVKNQDGMVTNYVATLFDITLSKAAADKIEHLAFYDPLTGLPNRRLLLDRLKPALASSHRNDRLGALLFIDMDNFKTLNDTLGHDFGDLLLQQVGERLTSCVREVDTVARLGGDEFVVMLEDLSEQTTEALDQTEVVGNKILATLNQPYLLVTHTYHSTPSIGATLFNGHEQSVDELLKQADIAMYHAKASGRNALRFFDPKMQASISARAALEADLRLALAENQFEMYYQLQITRNQQAVGAEALIRWHHPVHGLISPTDFIPLAEENGLILSIGQWVLETACAQIKAWESNELTQHLQLSANVSARQFHQANFVEQVKQVLSSNAINPNRLKLELTESLVLDDIDDTIIKMNALREIGVHISMDDFGTGHSSLSSLRKLPLDQLKIDQSFVNDILSDPDDAVIVKTIIAMANSLGIEVIAEGVETEAQRAFLEQNDCLLCQGYLFSKPVPIEQFELLLKQSKLED